MSIVDRAKNILVTPKTEWPVIAAEPATVNSLFTGYAVILALPPVVGTLLGAALFDRGGFGLQYGIVAAILGYVIGLVILFLMGVIADVLAPSFDGVRDRVAGTKLIVYAATAQWVAGFFAFIPGISVLVALAGFVYGAFLLYLGSTRVMRVPEPKAIGYTVVLIVIWIVLSMLVASLIVAAVMTSMFTGMMVNPALAT